MLASLGPNASAKLLKHLLAAPACLGPMRASLLTRCRAAVPVPLGIAHGAHAAQEGTGKEKSGQGLPGAPPLLATTTHGRGWWPGCPKDPRIPTCGWSRGSGSPFGAADPLPTPCKRQGDRGAAPTPSRAKGPHPDQGHPAAWGCATQTRSGGTPSPQPREPLGTPPQPQGAATLTHSPGPWPASGRRAHRLPQRFRGWAEPGSSLRPDPAPTGPPRSPPVPSSRPQFLPGPAGAQRVPVGQGVPGVQEQSGLR